MDINLMLLGKTGAGKSALGNSILGKKVFISKADMTSVTISSQKDVGVLEDERYVYVVDTPGVADTGYSEEEGKRNFLTAIQEGIAMSPYGYHALLYVIRYGQRLTKEDVDVVTHLKTVFGDKFLSQYGIIAVTCGDNFKYDHEEDGLSFRDFCLKQREHFAKLYKEVAGRVVLFDNSRGCSNEAKVSQRKELVELVDKLASKGCPYTDKTFQKAQEQYEKFLRENKTAQLCQEIRDETSLILGDFVDIEENQTQNVAENIERLGKLRDRLLELLAKIPKDKKRGDPLSKMESVARSILNKVQDLHRALQHPEDSSKEEKDRKKEETKGIQGFFGKVRDEINNLTFEKVVHVIGQALKIALQVATVWKAFRK